MSILPRDCRNAEIPLREVLQRTGIGLTQLSEKILDLEHAIWGAQTALDAPLEHGNALQTLDLLKQATDDLAGLLDRLGNAVPYSLGVSEIDVIAPMKLEALRRIVSSSSNVLQTSDQGTQQEEVELF